MHLEWPEETGVWAQSWSNNAPEPMKDVIAGEFVVRGGGVPVRWTEAVLKEHLDAAIKIASALLSENYLAQDRRRLIKCIELVDEANRAIDGGVWVAHNVRDPNAMLGAQAEVEPAKPASLIIRESEPARKAG